MIADAALLPTSWTIPYADSKWRDEWSGFVLMDFLTDLMKISSFYYEYHVQAFIIGK